VAFVSHFLLDFTAHLDSHAVAALGILNFTFGAVLIVWLVAREPDRRVVLGGALFGILIDLIEKVPPLGIAPQLVVVAIALWFCLPRRYKDLQPGTENT